MPTLRSPVSGLRVKTWPKVMKRPASCGQHWIIGKLRQVDLIAGQHHVLARSRPNVTRRDATEPGEHRHHLDFAQEAVGYVRFDQLSNALGHFVEILDAQRLGHAVLGAQHVNGQGEGRATNVLEQQAGTVCLADAIGDLGDLQRSDRLPL